jgi:hypothetical protein
LVVEFAGGPGEGIHWEGEEPAACEACGQIHEEVIRLIEEVVDADASEGGETCV